MVPDPAPWRGVWLKEKVQLTLADPPPKVCRSWWIKNNTGPGCPALASGGTKGLFETFLRISSWLLVVITAVEFLKPVRASSKSMAYVSRATAALV